MRVIRSFFLVFAAVVLGACATPLTTSQYHGLQDDVQSLADEVAADLSKFAPVRAIPVSSSGDQYNVGDEFAFRPVPLTSVFPPDQFRALVLAAATRWCRVHGFSEPQPAAGDLSTIQFSAHRGRTQLSVHGIAYSDPIAHPPETQFDLNILIHHA